MLNAWVDKNAGNRVASRALQVRDRDKQDVYLNIEEFPSYEEAMDNSNRPETTEFAALWDGLPVFRNLDLLNERTFQG